MRTNVNAEAAILTFFKGEGSNDGKGIDILSGNIGDFTGGFSLIFSGGFDATRIARDEYKEQRCNRQG